MSLFYCKYSLPSIKSSVQTNSYTKTHS